MLDEAISGNLNDAEYIKEPFFSLHIPKNIHGVPSEVLVPRDTWQDKNAYDKKAGELANMFKKNFEQFTDQASNEILNAGPKV